MSQLGHAAIRQSKLNFVSVFFFFQLANARHSNYHLMPQHSGTIEVIILDKSL